MSTYFVIGKQVAIKGKIIRLHSFFHFLGMHNLCKLTTLYSGYEKADDYNLLPLTAHEIQEKKPTSFLWNLWEPLFFQEQTNALIKSAFLQSAYFPLETKEGKPFCGTFIIHLTNEGFY